MAVPRRGPDEHTLRKLVRTFAYSECLLQRANFKHTHERMRGVPSPLSLLALNNAGILIALKWPAISERALRQLE